MNLEKNKNIETFNIDNAVDIESLSESDYNSIETKLGEKINSILTEIVNNSSYNNRYYMY